VGRRSSPSFAVVDASSDVDEALKVRRQLRTLRLDCVSA
jgi:hypothetical protein